MTARFAFFDQLVSTERGLYERSEPSTVQLLRDESDGLALARELGTDEKARLQATVVA